MTTYCTIIDPNSETVCPVRNSPMSRRQDGEASTALMLRLLLMCTMSTMSTLSTDGDGVNGSEPSVRAASDTASVPRSTYRHGDLRNALFEAGVQLAPARGPGAG